MRAAISRIHEVAQAAGRDPKGIGLEPQLNVGRGTLAGWEQFVRGWEALGATHLCLGTMGNGFTTPSQHLTALTRAANELGVGWANCG
jgi:hypothetical protein